jgi:signal transduction histidine kinase
MLGQTLSFAKPLKPNRQDVVVVELVQRVVREVSLLPSFAGMSVDVHCGADLRAHFDPQLVGEVLTNLLRNAAEACGSKGHVELRVERAGDGLVVDVADDGPGVPPNLREEIFKPFRSSQDYGTGIGLAFCRKVVESHGGAIELVSRPGDGACFHVSLPQSLTQGARPSRAIQ